MNDIEHNGVSVVVPIYNSEKYLVRCIDSLVNQSYSLLEILLIDDGSTDGCGTICDGYAEKYRQVKTYHKENGGISDAKNYGIAKATGKHVLFVDSDDYVDSQYVDNLVLPIINKHTDMVVCGYQIDYENDNYTLDAKTNFSKEYFKNDIAEAIFDLDSYGLFNVTVCKIYNRGILIKNGIKFDVNLTPGEDLIFNCNYFKYITSIHIVECTPYHYIRRDEVSLVNTYRSNLFDLVQIFNRSRKDLYDYYDMKSYKYEKMYGSTYINYLGACIPNMYRSNCDTTKNDKKTLIRRIISDSQLRYYISICDNSRGFTKLFVNLCKMKSVSLFYYAYTFLFILRNNFSRIYRRLRKVIFTKSRL